jgi:hypothetical protein
VREPVTEKTKAENVDPLVDAPLEEITQDLRLTAKLLGPESEALAEEKLPGQKEAAAENASPAPSPSIVVLEDIKARTVLELLEDTTLTEPEPVIEGVLALGDLITTFGAPKVMKSWTAKLIGLMTATGSEWLGFNITRPFKTIYLSAEGREARLRTRYQTLVGFTQVEEEGLERMSYVATQGRIKLDTEAGERTFFRLIEPFEVVIIDPYYRFIQEGDENSHRDQRKLQDLFDRVKDWGKAVILVHHSRKSGAGSEDAGISELRGAGLDGFTDAALRLSRQKDDDRYLLRLWLRNYDEQNDVELVKEGVVLKPAPDKKGRTCVPVTEVAEILAHFGELSAARLYAQIREQKNVSLSTAERVVADALKDPGCLVDCKPSLGPGRGRIYFRREAV